MSEDETWKDRVPVETRILAESLDGIAKAIVLLASAISPNTPGEAIAQSMSSRLEDLAKALQEYNRGAMYVR